MTDSGVLNYYFLLLAIFVVAVVVAYFIFSRRRNRKLLLVRLNRQDALEHDLERSQAARPWAGGRWRTSATNNTRAEGLDETGIAPPPYRPTAPEPSHPGSSQRDTEQAIRLQNLHASNQKPPDYAETTVDLKDSTPAGASHSDTHGDTS